jgi:uncharacterized RDD family membrane protein YckC
MSAAIDTSFELETPEHISFRYSLAGPARRGAAYLVDLLVRGLVLSVAFIVIQLTSSGAGDEFHGFETGALLLMFFALEWGYFVVFDLLSNGASPGKKAFRLRVIHQDGRPISFSDSVLRNLLRAADLLPLFYAVGVVSMMLDSKFRRLGDLVAQTVVVHESLGRLDDHEKSKVDRGDVEGLVARPRLTAAERDALLLFSRRVQNLSHARAEELADLIAPIFIERYRLSNPDKVELLLALGKRAH